MVDGNIISSTVKVMDSHYFPTKMLTPVRAPELLQKPPRQASYFFIINVNGYPVYKTRKIGSDGATVYEHYNPPL